MKKILALLGLTLCLSSTMSAQNTDSKGIFKHVGANVSVGTEGIGFGVATPVTNYLEIGFGLNFMPDYKVNSKVKVDDLKVSGLVVNGNKLPDQTIHMKEVDVNGSFARTTCDLKVNCYPFGGKSKFFVAAGFSFAGSQLITLQGHSEDVKDAILKYPQYKGQIKTEIDKYKVQFDDNGDINGDIRVSGFRPYLGLGFGRLVPTKRVGARLELGCHFQGKAKIYQGDQEIEPSDIKDKDDTFSKVLPYTTLYPVLKLSITGRIL